ncbi:MAG: peptidoglycan-binding domain-containing protein [Tardiphaga sp.]
MRALTLAFSITLAVSIVAIVDSAHLASAGLIETPRQTATQADPALATDEATQDSENQIRLNNAKRRAVQRGLTRLGFDTKANGKFDEPTRAAITRWQEEQGYPATGFLNPAQHKVLTDSAKEVARSDREAARSDRQGRRRTAGRGRNSRGPGGPIGAIGGAVTGVVGGVVGGIFRR